MPPAPHGGGGGALRLTPTEAPAWLPMLARRQAALHQTLADVRGALEKLGGTSPATQGLLQEAADLSAAVQRADIGNATAEAARAMDELEGRMHALRLPVVGLRTEALAGQRDRLVAWAGDPQVKVFRDSLLPEVCATGGLRMEACPQHVRGGCSLRELLRLRRSIAGRRHPADAEGWRAGADGYGPLRGLRAEREEHAGPVRHRASRAGGVPGPAAA